MIKIYVKKIKYRQKCIIYLKKKVSVRTKALSEMCLLYVYVNNLVNLNWVWLTRRHIPQLDQKFYDFFILLRINNVSASLTIENKVKDTNYEIQKA